MADVQDVQLNPALEDIQEIITERPELTQEEWETVGKATDWLKSTLKPEVRKELEVVYAKKQDEFQVTMRVEMQKAIKEHMETWQKSQEPLSQEELIKLLNQEYVEFPIRVRESKGEHKVRTFTICELPKEVEERFIKAAQRFLIPLIEQINAADWNLGSGSMIEQIQSLLQKLPAALDAATDIVAIILDPWEDDKDITQDWVNKNVSIPRISGILSAQMEANKYRDFFLNGSRSWTSLMKS